MSQRLCGCGNGKCVRVVRLENVMFAKNVNSLENNEFEQMDLYHMLGQIYAKNLSSAYVVQRNKLDILLERSDMHVNGQNVFYVLNEKVGEFNQYKSMK